MSAPKKSTKAQSNLDNNLDTVLAPQLENKEQGNSTEQDNPEEQAENFNPVGVELKTEENLEGNQEDAKNTSENDGENDGENDDTKDTDKSDDKTPEQEQQEEQEDNTLYSIADLALHFRVASWQLASLLRNEDLEDDAMLTKDAFRKALAKLSNRRMGQ